MDDRDIARYYGFTRIAIGAALFLLPRFVLRQWAGQQLAGGPGGALVGRALGVRDALLGAGIVAAIDGKGPGSVRQWLHFAAIADAVDAAAVLVSYRELPRRRRFLSFVAGCSGAAVGVALAQRLDD